METIKFDRKVKCGFEFVALRMLDSCDNIKIGDVYVPNTTATNMRLGFYIIEDIGSKAAEETGLVIGDYVLADRLSSFAHTEPVCLMKYDNLICKTDKDRTDFWPLRNRVFVDLDKTDEVSNIGGVYVKNYTAKMQTGTVVKTNVDEDMELPFEVGDKVMLVKGGDCVQMGSKTFYIYKPDMLICKFL